MRQNDKGESSEVKNDDVAWNECPDDQQSGNGRRLSEYNNEI